MTSFMSNLESKLSLDSYVPESPSQLPDPDPASPELRMEISRDSVRTKPDINKAINSSLLRSQAESSPPHLNEAVLLPLEPPKPETLARTLR